MTVTTPTHYRAFISQGPLSKERSSRLKVAKKQEMEPLQGERTVFYTSLYKKAEERAIFKTDYANW